MRYLNAMLVVTGIGCLGLMLALPTFETTQAAEKVIELKLANFFPQTAKQSTICEDFIRDLETRAGGRIKVRYFAGGSLLTAPNMYQGVEGGIADIGYSHVYYSPGRMPVTEAGGLPLGCPTAWVASQVVNDFYFKVRPKEWDRVKLLFVHGTGPHTVLSKKPVRKLEDLKGLTLRAPGVEGEVLKALGGTPAPTPMAEVYDAISKGVLDGVFSVYEVLKTFRFAEVIKYMTIDWQVGDSTTFYMAMNKNSYSKLPPDLKEMFDKLCGEYRERFALVWNAIEQEGKVFGTQKGVQYIELSDEESAKWKKATEPLVDGYIKTMVGKGFAESEVKGWISFLRERIDYYTKKQIEYRIPSPTGPDALRPENIGK